MRKMPVVLVIAALLDLGTWAAANAALDMFIQIGRRNEEARITAAGCTANRGKIVMQGPRQMCQLPDTPAVRNAVRALKTSTSEAEAAIRSSSN